jgi:hypothetical protein
MKSTKAVTYLLLISAILAGTSFKYYQIFAEISLWILMINRLLKEKFSYDEIILVIVFLISFSIAFLYRADIEILLNFKIYGMCITTWLYFKRFDFNLLKYVEYLIIISCILIIHQYIFDEFIITNHNFFVEYYRNRINDRPIGILFTPHASVTMLVVYLIYRIKIFNNSPKNIFIVISIFITALATSSLTAIVGFVAQLVIITLEKIKLIRKYFNFFTIIILMLISILILYEFKEEFIELLKKESYFRYYSVEIILNQLFDTDYYSSIIYFMPYSYSKYIDIQESFLGILGNEIGFIKLFVEGGLMLGLITLILIIRDLSSYKIFILVTLLHYSYFINYPLILAMMLVFQRKINSLK